MEEGFTSRDGRDSPDPALMELFDITQVALEQAMHGASMRQTALADNLANVNTPGYQRKDVEFHDALRKALGEAEFSGDPSSVSDVSFSSQTDSTATLTPDGNGVDMERESTTLAQNGLEYQALVQVAGVRNEILQNAMGTR